MDVKKIIPKPIKNILKHFFTVYVDTRTVYQLPQNCDKKQFAGKIAIVTGGGGGIGRAICIRLACEGAKVFVCGRTEQTLSSVVKEIHALGGIASPLVCDVTDYSAVISAFEDMYASEGHIDFLINSAGGSARERSKPFCEQDISVLHEVISTNLMGTVNTCHAASNALVKAKGGIVNISSIIGIGGKEKCSDYAAAKAGIIGFTRSLAIELSPLGVRCNVISPGKIQRNVMSKTLIQNQIRCNYVGYAGTPEDIANAVSFLLGDEAQFITGQNIIIDGGRTLGLHGD